eukprot:gene7885-11656_t
MELIRTADHALSLPFMKLELPRFLELGLTVPASWFGIPATSQTILPLLCAALAEGGKSNVLWLACFAVVAGWWTVWTYLLGSKGVRDGTDKLIGYPPLFLVTPYIGVGIVKLLSPTDVGTGIASLYVTSYNVIQIVSSIPKWIVLRRRPFKTLQQELRNVKRHYRLATDSKYIADKLAPYESFWSGDAAAAAGAGATVCLAASVGGVLSPELVFAAAASAQVAAFGRMYFHAHFFLDVFCGCICGAAVPIVIFAFADWQQFGFLQPCVAHLTFVAMYIGIRKALTKTHMETIVRDEAESAAQDVFQRTPGDNNGGGNAGAGSRRRALPKGKEWFIPTLEWQAVKEHHVCPQGLQYKMDVNAGTAADRIAAKRARIRAEKAAAKAKVKGSA